MKDQGNFTPQYLAGTGATEDSNSKPFSKDRIYMLTANVDVRVLFGADAGTGSDVGATEGAIIPAGAWFTFRAGPLARYVYVEAADGTSPYRASVWQREV
jgi:hypothetical protein